MGNHDKKHIRERAITETGDDNIPSQEPYHGGDYGYIPPNDAATTPTYVNAVSKYPAVDAMMSNSQYGKEFAIHRFAAGEAVVIETVSERKLLFCDAQGKLHMVNYP